MAGLTHFYQWGPCGGTPASFQRDEIQTQEMEDSLVGWKIDRVPKSSSSSTSYLTPNVSFYSQASVSSSPGPEGLYEAI